MARWHFKATRVDVASCLLTYIYPGGPLCERVCVWPPWNLFRDISQKDPIYLPRPIINPRDQFIRVHESIITRPNP
jgi:hypothetical protein